ncbi:hypothetical protein [Streptomyces hydrogenans]|uniref:Secreted protein n=1 Tax=Streptomyces hydrogenans TaxID=1873719 RepID=A0ABQ3PJK5_9ACTN|nr:hypothetical protein [Streptomyces hydrogenans]GHG10211.1 hypothetical protein GCM10018784_23650 [Streptomyces hydrogenans]GHI25183.1 hypothetical protein Shyd_65540 [Streptomyces hydrogenans]
MTYFEDNPEIFAALVAAIAILGGLFGSIIGAKIQANGGRDQAAAAREAAQIAAEAQRVAALWTVRQVQVAEFIQQSHEVRRLCSKFFTHDSFNGVLDQQLSEARHVLLRRKAEVDLIAPRPVAGAARELIESIDRYRNYSISRGPGQYLYRELLNASLNQDVDLSVLAAYNEVLRALSEYVSFLESVQPGPMSDAADAEYRRAYRAAHQITCDVGGFTSDQASELIGYTLQRDPHQTKIDHENSLEGETEALVTAAREMLRSEDDVAPAVPEQRRRRWRAGAGR